MVVDVLFRSGWNGAPVRESGAKDTRASAPGSMHLVTNIVTIRVIPKTTAGHRVCDVRPSVAIERRPGAGDTKPT